MEFFCYQLNFIVCNRKLTLYTIFFAESAKTEKIVISVENIGKNYFKAPYLWIEPRFNSEIFTSLSLPEWNYFQRKMFFKNLIKTSFHQNSHFQNFKIFGLDFALSKILKSFIKMNKFYILQVENL